MKDRQLIIIFGLFLFQLILVLFLDYVSIIYLSLVSTLILLGVSMKNLTGKITGIYVALLGYAVLGFFDIFKFNTVFSKHFVITESHYKAAIWIYFGFVLFLGTYLLSNQRKKIDKPLKIRVNRQKILFIVFPICLVILFFYNSLILLYDSHSPYLLLLSFFPKSATVIAFYMYLKVKKPIYLIYFLIFILFSFSEVSRRIYITLAFILVPIFMSYIINKHGRIKTSYKFIVIIFFGFAFFFMNYLRADWEGSDWGSNQGKLQSTVNYMLQFKAIDTFDNTAFVLENIPSKYRYYYGSTYTAILFQFIPRSLWADKPVGFGAPLGLLKKAGDREFTVEKWKRKTNMFSYSPGFLCEAYANFGNVGMVLISILFGFLTKAFDRKVTFRTVIRDFDKLPYLAFFSSFFLILRGDFIMAVFFSLLFFIYLWLMVRFCMIKVRVKSN